MMTPFEWWVPNAPNNHLVAHWEGVGGDSMLDGTVLGEQLFYFTDNLESWSSPHLPSGNLKLLIFEVFVFNPLIIKDNKRYPTAGLMELNLSQFLKMAREGGHDSIICIPDDIHYCERQGVLLEPDVQIKNVFDSSVKAWRF